MQNFKSIFVGVGLLCFSCSTVLAQNTASNNAVLLKATGPYEDMAHYAIAKKTDKVVKYLADADAGAGEVGKILSASELAAFEKSRQQLHQAVDKKDWVAAAESSVTIFRSLVDRLDASTLVVPKEVELLDYAGYKLDVLATASKPDWNAISKLAAESEVWWKAIADRVADKHLRATVTSAIAGIKQAAEQKNLAMLQLGAQIDLDLVDMLEVGFKTASKAAAIKP